MFPVLLMYFVNVPGAYSSTVTYSESIIPKTPCYIAMLVQTGGWNCYVPAPLASEHQNF